MPFLGQFDSTIDIALLIPSPKRASKNLFYEKTGRDLQLVATDYSWKRQAVDIPFCFRWGWPSDIERSIWASGLWRSKVNWLRWPNSIFIQLHVLCTCMLRWRKCWTTGVNYGKAIEIFEKMKEYVDLREKGRKAAAFEHVTFLSTTLSTRLRHTL